MMHYEPPSDGRVIKPAEQQVRQQRYNKRIALALIRYEAWKQNNRRDKGN